MKTNRLICASPIPILLLIGNSPASITTDCRSLQHDILRASHGEALTIKLEDNSICHLKTLEISGKKNLVLDGRKSTIIFNPNNSAIHVGRKSENISISNINIDYDPLPFTQGIITKISDGYFSFSIMDRYPPVGKNNNRVLIYDRNTKDLKRNGSTLYFRSFEIDKDGKSGKIPFSGNYQANLHVGDYIAFRPRGRPAIYLDGLSRNIRLNNISIFSSPGMGVMGRFLDGNNHINVRIIPGPPPLGSDRPRLLSTNSDAVNFAYSRKGPTIKNSYISRQGDDGINLHGLILAVRSIVTSTDAIILRSFGNDNSIESILRPGDLVRFLAKDDFRILGRAKIREFRKIGSRRLGRADNIADIFPRAFIDGAKSGTFYAISFFGNIPANTGYLDAMSAACGGFQIKNNRISSNRGHGIVVGASDGLISGNIITNTTHNSIIVGPNFDPWREGSWPSHVSIVGNNIINPCMDGAGNRRINELSSIFVGSDIKYNHYENNIDNISIYRNKIESCNGRWIESNNTKKISEFGNIFQ